MAALLEPVEHEEYRSYGDRLEEGFLLLHSDEELIIDKWGNVHNSGCY